MATLPAFPIPKRNPGYLFTFLPASRKDLRQLLVYSLRPKNSQAEYFYEGELWWDLVTGSGIDFFKH